MEKDNCEMLFEYLKSILYDSPIRPLHVESWMPRTENWDLGFSICRRP